MPMSRWIVWSSICLLCGAVVQAAPRPAAHEPGPALEPRQRLVLSVPAHERDIVLTLDACSGGFDAALIDTLVRLRVPATLFVTQRWLRRNADAVRMLRAHGDLFEFENHGAAHVPAVIGRSLYGMPGQPDAGAVVREVGRGAQAVADAFGQAPGWYRGAGAAYDDASLRAIAPLGARVAGYSLNADDGATLSARGVAARLRRAVPGDIVLAHMNHPGSGTAQGLASSLPDLQQRGFRFVKLSQVAGVQDTAAVRVATRPWRGAGAPAAWRR